MRSPRSTRAPSEHGARRRQSFALPSDRPAVSPRFGRKFKRQRFYASGVSDGAKKSFLVRALPFALAIPLVAIPAVAFFALSDAGRGERLSVAQGSLGGTFHPMAGTFVPDSTVLVDCDGESGCVEQAFGNLSFRQGPKQALAVFEGRMSTDPKVEQRCHRIVHAIGSAALERYDGNVARTFSEGSPTCVSGYYHGILDRAFVGISSEARLRTVARSLCVGDGIRRRGFLDYQCRHGLGHGLMIQTGYDLPLALSVCSALDTSWDHLACTGGVFMENVDTRFGYRSPWLDDKDPLYPCNRLQARDQRPCYLRASWRILENEGGAFSKTAARCAQLARWAPTCFRGYGRDAADHARYASKKILALCRLARGWAGECLLGASRTIANASGQRGVGEAAALCRQAARSERGSCFVGVGLVLGMLHPTNATRQSACVALTSTYQVACANAAIAGVDPGTKTAWG